MKNIVFIVGSGHSGSTILDMALGSSVDAFSLGEIEELHLELSSNTPCVCGPPIKSCEFWKEVCYRIKRAHDIDFMRKPYSFRLMPEGKRSPYMLMRVIEDMKKVFGASYSNNSWMINTKILYDTIFVVSKVPVLIDSSKDIMRALMLRKFLKNDYNFRIIHLVRDVRGVVHSNMKSYYRVKFPGSTTFELKPREAREATSVDKAILSWIYVNILIIGITRSLLKRDQWRQVRYEDLSDGPNIILPQVSQWIGITYDDNMINFGNTTHHNVSGNPSRFNSTKIIPSRKNWKESLSKDDLMLIKRRAGFLARFCGYDWEDI